MDGLERGLELVDLVAHAASCVENEGDVEGNLLITAKFGRDPKPARVHLAYDNDAFFRAAKAAKITKTLRVTDQAGRKLLLTFQWSKARQHKANHSYRPDSVRIRPADEPREGAAQSHTLPAEKGRKIQLTIQY